MIVHEGLPSETPNTESALHKSTKVGIEESEGRITASLSLIDDRGDKRNVGFATVTTFDNSAVIYDMHVSEQGSGNGTTLYKGVLGHIVTERPEITHVFASVAHPHMASIMARNVPEGWQAVFSDARGHTYTPEELLNNSRFQHNKENPDSFMMNFDLSR